MFDLEQVAIKLDNILNGTDEEILELGFVRNNDFLFVVQTEGEHLDYINDKATGKNFIPVYLTVEDGSVNPVPDLKQFNVTISVSIYYPTRFKEIFHNFNDYLVECICGRVLSWCSGSNVVGNISLPRFGEMRELDLKQFEEWVGSVYRKPIDKTDMYSTMVFNLFLGGISSNYYMSNEVEMDLTLTIGNNTYTEEDIRWENAHIESSTDPAAQQLLNETTPEVSGLPFKTGYSQGFTLVAKKDTFFNNLIAYYTTGQIQKCSFSLEITIGSLSVTRNVYLSSVNMGLQRGEPISITFSFGKKVGV